MPRPRKAAQPERIGQETRLITVDGPPAAVATPTRHIEVTPAVKRAASDALSAIGSVDFEELAELGVNTVQIRCTNMEVATELVRQLNNLPRPAPETLPEVSTPGSRDVSVPLDLYLPQDFTELLTDAAETELTSLPISIKQSERLRAVTQTFSGAKIVRIRLETTSEQTDPAMDIMRQSVWKAHKTLITATRWIVEAISDTPLHDVRIEPSSNVMNALRFTVDGTAVELGQRSQRALCVLALLQPLQPFTCKQFTTLYSNTQVTPSKDFFNIMRAVKKDLPQLKWTHVKNNRWIQGVRFISTASDNELRAFLAGCIKE